jgi:hydrogenase maturation protein HypF
MLLEGMAQKPSKQVYPFKLQSENGQISVDTAGIIKGLIKNRRSPRKAAAAFHNTLAEIILAAARKINIKQVALSGGVFQNKILLAACSANLGKAGFRVYTNNAAPAGDGGLALGQLYAKAKNFI